LVWSDTTPSKVLTKLLNTNGVGRSGGSRKLPYRRANFGGSGAIRPRAEANRVWSGVILAIFYFLQNRICVVE
jgi:hypothetical protein